MERSFTFDWEQGEMTRAARATQWGTPRLRVRQLGVLVAAVALMLVAFLLLSRGAEDPGALWRRYLPWVGAFVLYFLLMTWLKPVLMVRRFARQHPVAGTRLTRSLSDTGLRAEAVTGAVELPWAGMPTAVETPEFFLFYTTSGGALYLPKRAVTEASALEEIREHLRRHLGGRARLLAGAGRQR